MSTLREVQSDILNGVVWKLADGAQTEIEDTKEQPEIILGNLIELHGRPMFDSSRYPARYDFEPLGQAFSNTFTLIKSSAFHVEVRGLDFESVCEVIMEQLISTFCHGLIYYPADELLTLIADVLTYAVNKGLFIFPEG